MQSLFRRSRRRPLSLSLCVIASSIAGSPASAGELVDSSATVSPGDVPDAWRLKRSSLTVLPGAASGSVMLSNNSRLTSAGAIVHADGVGIVVSNASGEPGSGLPSIVRLTDGSAVSGGTHGASLSAGVDLVATGSSISGIQGYGMAIHSAKVSLAGGTTVTGHLAGLSIRRDDRGEALTPTYRRVSIDASAVTGSTGSGILVDAGKGTSVTDAVIALTNGAIVQGGNGVAFDLRQRTDVVVTADRSRIVGDISAAQGARATVSLSQGATLAGGVSGDVTATIASGSTWTPTRTSSVSRLALEGGAITFAPPQDARYRALAVRGDLTGSGGDIAFHTRLDAVGAIATQATDRLLVEGNVTRAGTTRVSVVPMGVAIDTDTNRNGRLDADEGISLIQVGGDARPDAFVLRGGYVAVGGYQYALHAFGPGQADPSQNVLPTGALLWDYRLGTVGCTENDCGVTPPPPPPPPGDGEEGEAILPPGPCEGETCGPGVEPPPTRPAVVPQLPSYLSAPAALLTYAAGMHEGLRERLGELRDGLRGAPLAGEVFVRYLGSQSRYRANHSFARYGYAFDQQSHALQWGGGLVSFDGDDGTLRAGWALDRGTTRVSPQAVDGRSTTWYRAMGGAAWVTWQSGAGWWVDAVVAGHRYRGDVATDLRGSDVARLHASGSTWSVEVGRPFAAGAGWLIEPRAQVMYQTLRVNRFADGDGLAVDLGLARQVRTRIGVRVSRTTDSPWSPYARVDLSRSDRGDPSVRIGSDAWGVSDRFGSGRVGSAAELSGGITRQLSPNVQLYGEGTYERFVGGYGMRGWRGHMGVRVTF
ncbi:autotransporter outer membrane beta-barrel domain-containing protein [Luteibacter sp. PPL554]